jgi:signal peptidase I
MVGRGAQFVTTTGPTGPEAHDGDATAVLPTQRLEDVPASDQEPRPPKKRRSRLQRLVIEWVLLIAAALAIAFLIKSFLFQAFYIPSSSMEPTLEIEDRVLVNKLSYDFHDVNRGDIVVFEAPPEARTDDIEDFVKRVIGLAGETVTFPGDGKVYVDGRELDEPYLPNGVTTCNPDLPCPQSEDDGTQQVPPGCGAPASGEDGCVVPDGTVLVLGDNREYSKDGRSFGPIEEDLIIGRVFMRIWPIGSIGFL